ncbi:uncharacterized protein LOC123871454 isoform X1 [Maniola jurtina]|uniref:uncharacterized protein LOC123871454 isoform X1 n=1 Tax=Maniola jurtina TaxID=191418 RepID=UPI001E688255|nr:uncharacterized protein LOC123871454 isoform X1 [Maniola jurtina]XP_045771248.1 uncharacterized protein LOC123871454 isoform X1 [Maniola jurtina]
MSRSYVPTHEQIEILVDFIERKRWLATGHARTTHARQRTRTAWQDVAQKLNKVDCGCRKTWQQWAKYWKDKKGAIKRKVALMRANNKTQTGDDGEEEVITLSSMEKRMVALLGGKILVRRNNEEENDPFANFNLGDHHEGTKPFNTTFVNDTPPGGSDRTDCEQNTRNSEELRDEKPSLRRNSMRHDPSDTSIPRQRRLMTPPSPHRQCQMVDFSERIIAIEERRVETERIIAQSQQELVGVLRQMSEAWTLQSAAIKDLVSKLIDK